MWLIRYLNYLLTATLANKQSECHKSTGAFVAQLVHDVLLGILVVLFIFAYIFRSANTRMRKEWAIYVTLFVELLLESALVVYYVLYLYFDKPSHTSQVVWHGVWIFHLSLIIYRLLPVFICFPFICIPGRRAAFFKSITGGRRHRNKGSRRRSTQIQNTNNVSANVPNSAGSDRADSTPVATSSLPGQRSQPAFVPKSAAVSPRGRAERVVDTPFGPVAVISDSSS